METKYIPQETANQIIKFMEICEEVHPNIAFKVKDTEECIIYTRNIEKIISEIDGGDEEFGFNVIDRETKEVLGWFRILPYEEDFICDCSDNDFCKEVCDRLADCSKPLGKENQWLRYIEYLKSWANDHCGVEYEGMSPACFDEFCDNDDD